jgi:hypothetical protein
MALVNITGLEASTRDIPKFGGDEVEFPLWQANFINLAIKHGCYAYLAVPPPATTADPALIAAWDKGDAQLFAIMYQITKGLPQSRLRAMIKIPTGTTPAAPPSGNAAWTLLCDEHTLTGSKGQIKAINALHSLVFEEHEHPDVFFIKMDTWTEVLDSLKAKPDESTLMALTLRQLPPMYSFVKSATELDSSATYAALVEACRTVWRNSEEALPQPPGVKQALAVEHDHRSRNRGNHRGSGHNNDSNRGFGSRGGYPSS